MVICHCFNNSKGILVPSIFGPLRSFGENPGLVKEHLENLQTCFHFQQVTVLGIFFQSFLVETVVKKVELHVITRIFNITYIDSIDDGLWVVQSVRPLPDQFVQHLEKKKRKGH